MTRRIIIALMTLGLVTHMTGCTSGSSKGNGDTAVSSDETFAEEGEGDFAEDKGSEKDALTGENADEPEKVAEKSADKPEDAKAKDEAKVESSAEPEEDLALDENPEKPPQDELSLDEGGEPEKVAKEPDPNAAPPAQAKEEAPKSAPPPTDEPLFSDNHEKQSTTAEPPPPVAENNTPPIVEEAAPSVSDTAPMEPAYAPETVAAASTFVPVQKIKDVPFSKNGTLLNRVYLARPNDTTKSVAEKIYGDGSRSKDLVKWNPNLARGMKTGDKVYYNSPSAPSDNLRMMTYFEDAGVPPSIYTTKEGDNIRKVSKRLLGSSESWKEVWATNPMVESKGDVPGGLDLRYWPEGLAAAPALAANTMSAPADMKKDIPPPMDAMANTVPPPSPDFSQAPPPPPDIPPAPHVASGPDPLAPPPDMAQAPPPPPPPVAAGPAEDPLAPPPLDNPPPVKEHPVAKKKPAAQATTTESGTDSDTMISLAIGGILILTAAVLLVVVRKNRAKKAMAEMAAHQEVTSDLGQTQV